MDIPEQVQDSVAKAKEQVLEDLDFMNLGKFSQHFGILKFKSSDTFKTRVCPSELL